MDHAFPAMNRTAATSRLTQSQSRPITPASFGKPSQRRLLRDDEVPPWLRLKNIRTGYRPPGGTALSCLLSLFDWHNQTLNAWTMLLGIVASLVCWALLTQELKPQGHDAFVFFCPNLTVFIHVPFSVAYHLLLPMSFPVLRRTRALDIAFIFVGSVPLTYCLAYYAMPFRYVLLLTGAALALALQAIFTSINLPTGTHVDKGANTRFVGCIVAVYLTPMVWRSAHDLASGATTSGPVLATLATLTSLAFGAGVYVHSFPDLWRPGQYDLVGACQQLMHLGIVGAHIAEFAFIACLYVRRQQELQLGA